LAVNAEDVTGLMPLALVVGTFKILRLRALFLEIARGAFSKVFNDYGDGAYLSNSSWE
jgi:hypothetical protein